MKAKDLREKSISDLRKNSAALRKERVLMRLQNAAGSLESTARFGVIARDIARIETILTERRSAAVAKA